MRNQTRLIVVAAGAMLAGAWSTAAEQAPGDPPAKAAMEQRIASLEEHIEQLEARIATLEARPTITLRKPLQPHVPGRVPGPDLRRERRQRDPYDANIYFLEEIEPDRGVKLESDSGSGTDDESADR